MKNVSDFMNRDFVVQPTKFRDLSLMNNNNDTPCNLNGRLTAKTRRRRFSELALNFSKEVLMDAINILENRRKLFEHLLTKENNVMVMIIKMKKIILN